MVPLVSYQAFCLTLQVIGQHWIERFPLSQPRETFLSDSTWSKELTSLLTLPVGLWGPPFPSQLTNDDTGFRFSTTQFDVAFFPKHEIEMLPAHAQLYLQCGSPSSLTTFNYIKLHVTPGPSLQHHAYLLCWSNHTLLHNIILQSIVLLST